jgi:hypothetical protein
VLNRYALIIGNEDYQSMQRTLNSEQNVAFAVNDATVFRDYAVKTLGVEQENITFLTNATAGQMSQQIDKVCKMLSKLGNKAELIVYYAGHGYPDENTKVPYLIPVVGREFHLKGAKLSTYFSGLFLDDHRIFDGLLHVLFDFSTNELIVLELTCSFCSFSTSLKNSNWNRYRLVFCNNLRL